MASDKAQDIVFKEGSQAAIFELACKPNKQGQGNELLVKHFPKYGLDKFGNGSGWARDDGPLGRKYKIFRRKDDSGRIVAVNVTGWAEPKFDGVICADVYVHYKDEKCRVLGTSRCIEMDHKDGRKHAYKPVESAEEFQPLSKSANDAKRTHCQRCAGTNERFDATTLGYCVPVVSGTIKYRGSCVGCYWFDPKAFNASLLPPVIVDL